MPLAEPSTATSLLNLVREKDPQAWAKFANLYGPLVYSWARRAGLQDADAADVAQDVFRSVARSIDTFRRDRPGDKFRSWLWTITRNGVRRHCNRQQVSLAGAGGTDAWRELEQVPEILDSDEFVHEPAADVRLTRRALELIRAEFNERTWQSFWRMTVLQHSAAEIGRDLGLSEAAIRQGKYRVLCRLREMLEGM